MAICSDWIRAKLRQYQRGPDRGLSPPGGLLLDARDTRGRGHRALFPPHLEVVCRVCAVTSDAFCVQGEGGLVILLLIGRENQ